MASNAEAPLRGTAEDGAAPRVPVALALGRAVPRAEVGDVEREAEAGLALAERVLGGLALGDVADRRGKDLAVVVEPDGVDGEFDGELAAVGADGGELDARAEDRSLAGREVVRHAVWRGPLRKRVGTMRSAMISPITSSVRNPNVCSAAGLNSRTRPSRSMVRTASRADSKTPRLSASLAARASSAFFRSVMSSP